MRIENRVKDQYERFPYPPVGALALPRKGQGQGLKFETGAALQGQTRSHDGIRILVAGCGTLEALVVAQAHPRASELVAIDLSQSSLTRFKRRLTLAKVARFPFKIPRVRTLCQDLTLGLDLSEKFDYILASNVLHHVAQPDELLITLARNLKPGGLLRIVTYPKASRLWMRETSRWLRWGGISSKTPRLVERTQACIQALPMDHPIRSCFESQPEAHTATGIVDAFLNACENPLSPLEWKEAARRAHLTCIGETQTESSRSTFLSEVVPALNELHNWEKLQILDDLLEICSNPVLWFRCSAGSRPVDTVGSKSTPLPKGQPVVEPGMVSLNLPSRVFWEMKQNLLRCQSLLESSGSSLRVEDLFRAFQTQVGPRVNPLVANQPLRGLAITDRPFSEIMEAQEPWSLSNDENLRISCPEYPHEIPGRTLDEKFEWLQLRWGAVKNLIPILIES